jgi:hypothetical protein
MNSSAAGAQPVEAVGSRESISTPSEQSQTAATTDEWHIFDSIAEPTALGARNDRRWHATDASVGQHAR